MSKRKLLIFHPALAPYRVDFFNALGRLYCCKIFFLTHNNANQSFNQEALLANVSFEYEYLDKHWVVLKRNINLGYWNAIKAFNPDIVLCCEYGLSLLSTFVYKKLHPRTTFSIFTSSDDSLKMITELHGIRKHLILFYRKRINGVIVTNPFVAKYYQEKLDMKHSFYFPIIYDDDKYKAKIEKALSLANDYVKMYSLNGMKVFLFVGRLVDKIKNISAALYAFHGVKEPLRAKSKFIIIGAGEDLEMLKEICNKLELNDNVIFAGRYEGDKLLAWYSAADFLILPSVHEPFGAVTAEALQAGCRGMISCNAGSNCLINKENGIVFNPENRQEFIQALTEMSCSAQPTSTPTLRPSRLPMKFNELIKGLYNFLNE